MRAKLIAAGLLGCTMLAPAAIAQTPPPANQQPLGASASGGANTQFVTQGRQGNLRISDLIDRDVYGANNEEIGEVEDVLIDQSGRITAFIIEIDDGPLGLDERTVAVPLNAVRVDPIDTTATTGTIPGAGLPASTAEGQQVRNESRISQILALDRIVLTMSADQLQSAPEFDDDD